MVFLRPQDHTPYLTTWILIEYIGNGWPGVCSVVDTVGAVDTVDTSRSVHWSWWVGCHFPRIYSIPPTVYLPSTSYLHHLLLYCGILHRRWEKRSCLQLHIDKLEEVASSWYVVWKLRISLGTVPAYYYSPSPPIHFTVIVLLFAHSLVLFLLCLFSFSYLFPIIAPVPTGLCPRSAT